MPRPLTTKSAPVVLTAQDWEEISAALWTKAQAIRDGRYGPEDAEGQDAEWVEHLEAIGAKIGPDGQDAVRNGVAACG